MWQWGECRVDADELMHYGVKGQKHGIRRYQNEDGTLTAEGKARYGDMRDRDRGSGLIRSQLRSSQKSFGNAFANHRTDRYKARIEKHTDKYNKKINADKEAIKALKDAAKKDPSKKGLNNAIAEGLKEHSDRMAAKRDKKVAKYESKQAAQKAANANLEAYRRHTKTGSLSLTNRSYQQARARGEGKLSSFIEGYGGLVGAGLKMHRNKKAYGKRIIWAEQAENEYYANGMDD